MDAWNRISTVVSIGAIPPELVDKAHAHSVKVLFGVPLSVTSPELATTKQSPRGGWINNTVNQVQTSDGDGVCFLLHTLPDSNTSCNSTALRNVSASLTSLIAAVSGNGTYFL